MKKQKKSLSEIEQEVSERFLPEKLANTLAAMRDLDLEIAYLESPQGKGRLSERKGREFVEKTVSQMKAELEDRKSYYNFIKTIL